MTSKMVAGGISDSASNHSVAVGSTFTPTATAEATTTMTAMNQEPASTFGEKSSNIGTHFLDAAGRILAGLYRRPPLDAVLSGTRV
jgi:hypothetical protein